MHGRDMMLRHHNLDNEGLIIMARSKCSKVGKDKFPNKLEADLAIVDIQISNSHHRRRKYRDEPQRSYLCGSCKHWHMTKQPELEQLTA